MKIQKKPKIKNLCAHPGAGFDDRLGGGGGSPLRKGRGREVVRATPYHLNMSDSLVIKACPRGGLSD